MIQFSHLSDRFKYTFPEAVALVVSASKSKLDIPGGGMPPMNGITPSPSVENKSTLTATFNVYCSTEAHAANGQAVETIMKTWTIDSSDEAYAKAEELLEAEVSGTII